MPSIKSPVTPRLGVLLWQTARLRLVARAGRGPVSRALSRVLRSSTRSRWLDEGNGPGGGADAGEYFMQGGASPTPQKHSPVKVSTIETPVTSPGTAANGVAEAEVRHTMGGFEVELCLAAGSDWLEHSHGPSFVACTLWYDPETMRFCWAEQGGDAKASTVGLSAITSVVFGPCTKSFRSFGAISAPWRCFSLVTADGTHDFCSVRDRDARTAIVAVQLLKCGGDRRYARLGVLLWQTARLRLKMASRQEGVCCASALARLLVSCTPA